MNTSNTVQSELTKIKFIKGGKHKGKIKLGQVLYTPFLIGKIPNKFGFIYDEDNDREGIYQWFNLGGLTFLHIPESSWN